MLYLQSGHFKLGGGENRNAFDLLQISVNSRKNRIIFACLILYIARNVSTRAEPAPPLDCGGQIKKTGKHIIITKQ